MNPPTLIFDLDGTLLDTLTDIGEAANRALADAGFPAHSMDAFRTLVGDGVVVLFQRALPQLPAKDPAVIDQCVARFKHHYDLLWDQTSRPYDGIETMLDQLSAQGATLAVLSNKPDEFTQICVNRFLHNYHFSVVLGSKPDFPCKPHPEGVHRILRSLSTNAGTSLTAEQCLYLGDTNTDMQTALSAGCIPIGVTWGFRTADELRQAGARFLIDHPSELQTLLTQLL